MQNVKLNIFPTEDEVLINMAAYFIETAKKAISANGMFNVSLSGGSSPKKLYEMLASSDYKEKVVWENVYFFFGDERNVPADHPDSNFLMAKKALFDPLQIPASQIIPVNTSLPPEQAAEAYALAVYTHFKPYNVKFDLILLGLGDNSHTASLFPHTSILEDQESTVKAVFLEDQQVYRISMTAPMINDAHHIAFLVYGKGKAEAVHHVLEDDTDIEEYPAQLIQPEQGAVQWFMDEAAASLLSKKG
ncbi:6-phosphogluconolactonase [Mucilaginibacter arboris]|uniref:6-phosphogluconolactonase n=1 Tax=Mucilaginibacter arboris TaxID=2682090 RepID=A0A7K1SYB7_9SPHI|nr:6-phosphogluconolactonase [Mucilaginibacter arboris]MVN22315.1 6-phosphogluconolactonase [Mucilaginibacter arboris]